MLTVTPDPEWQRQAACLGMDPDLFFPPSGTRGGYLAWGVLDAQLPERT